MRRQWWPEPSECCRQRSETVTKVVKRIAAGSVRFIPASHAPRPGSRRKLRLQNKKIEENLVNVDGGLEFLQACGFQLLFEEDDGCGRPCCCSSVLHAAPCPCSRWLSEWGPNKSVLNTLQCL